jgi:hypothetical protein
MSRVAPDFRVMSCDDNGDPVCCSYCTRPVPRVVVLPLTQRPELDARLAASDGEALWVGLCAGCVDALVESLGVQGRAT